MGAFCSTEAWNRRAREMRHNPCLASPLTALILFGLCLFWMTTMILKFPTMMITFFASPLLHRVHWIVEFLYPTSVGRWIHFVLVRLVSRSKNHQRPGATDKNRGFHSRTIEQRVEVIPGRVYIHPLCQLLDNLGYLIVCCPAPRRRKNESTTVSVEETSMGKVSVESSTTSHEDATSVRLPVVALVVDCGDAQAVIEQVQYITDLHYENTEIQIQAICSTHKHHDHTAGNVGLKELYPQCHIFGGAVEGVPGCSVPLRNGDLVPLPKVGDNDMGELVELEAIATPGHTRGSLTYCLRPRTMADATGAAFLFTGDTFFSGGKGQMFEADMDYPPGKSQDDIEHTQSPTSLIRATSGMYAAERCFSEILARSVRHADFDNYYATKDRIAIMPGHEYTQELLGRQFSITPDASNANDETTKWKHYSPSVFFETVSHLYVALHRRALPNSSGKLPAAMSTLRRELSINPQLRRLKRRGQVVVQAITFWHDYFAKQKVPASTSLASPSSYDSARESVGPNKTPSTVSRWNLDSENLDNPVFTTVYASELNAIIQELQEARDVDPLEIAKKLRKLKASMDVPAVGRRPIPGALPSDRVITKGLLGLVMLGSSPAAMTFGDAKYMKLPRPIVAKTSDGLLICRKRLIAVLYWLGLLTDEWDGKRVVEMINQLWRETKEYSRNYNNFDLDVEAQQRVEYNAVSMTPGKTSPAPPDEQNGNHSSSKASTGGSGVGSLMETDSVELGALRWMLYGVPAQPPSWLGRRMMCLPCCSVPHKKQPPHAIESSNLERNSGELVRHDVFTCQLCANMTGCPHVEEDDPLEESNSRMMTIKNKLNDRDQRKPLMTKKTNQLDTSMLIDTRGDESDGMETEYEPRARGPPPGGSLCSTITGDDGSTVTGPSTKSHVKDETL